MFSMGWILVLDLIVVVVMVWLKCVMLGGEVLFLVLLVELCNVIRVCVLNMYGLIEMMIWLIIVDVMDVVEIMLGWFIVNM